MFHKSEYFGLQPYNYYSHQILINLNYRDSVFYSFGVNLKKKWDAANSNQCTLFLGDSFKDFICNPNNGLTRLYILSHCDVGSDSITADQGPVISYKQLAKQIAHFIGKAPVTINLISCSAAKGYAQNNFDSFAAKFQAELNKQTKRNIPVIARSRGVFVGNVDTEKTTLAMHESQNHVQKVMKLRDSSASNDQEQVLSDELNKMCVNHQYGSKFIFVGDSHGQQMQLDAYYVDWRNSVALLLTDVMNRIDDKHINNKYKNMLEHMVGQLPKMNDVQILNGLREIVRGLTPSYGGLSLHAKPSHRKEKHLLLSLIDEGERILNSPHTKSEPVYTGRKLC